MASDRPPDLAECPTCRRPLAYGRGMCRCPRATTGDYDHSIHSNPDAAAWARFFMETARRNGWRIEGPDEATMAGWFANAMMAMHDAGPTRAGES